MFNSKGLRSTEFAVTIVMQLISLLTAYSFSSVWIIIGAQVTSIAYIFSRTHVKKNDGVTKIDNITVRK